jgi:hypothetical protein
MKLLSESISHEEMEFLCEEYNGKQRYKIKGPFLQSEVRNRNGRIYSRDLIEREVVKFVNEKVNTGRAMGELDHPPSPQTNLDRVSHVIESLVMQGDSAIGVARILSETPCGRIAESLLKEGIKLGVSSRGVGKINKENIVNESYKLLTVDIVADPSAPNAYVDGILENKEYIIDGDLIIEKTVDNFTKQLKNKGKSREIKSILFDFVNSLKS